MRIQGFFRAEDNAPYVTATIVQDKFNISNSISFLVDSGASATVIADTDAVRLGLDYRKLQQVREGMTGIGGTVQTFILQDVKLMFLTEDGIYEERLENIYVIRHHVTDERLKARIEKIPSLLGRDILNKYTVLLKKSDDVVLITDENMRIL